MASKEMPFPLEMVSQKLLADLRVAACFCGCRLEMSSDVDGALGRLCVTASSPDRELQGFGQSIEEAVNNLRTQPTRRSTAKKE